MTAVSPTADTRHTANSQARSLPRWATWFLLGTALIGCSDAWRLAGNVRVLDPAVDTRLAPDWAWSTPVSLLDLGNGLSIWPGWLFAVVAGGAIALAVSRVATRQSLLIAAVLGGGLALAMTPRDLLPAVSLLALSRLAEMMRDRGFIARTFASWGAIVGFSLVVTLEFGFVALAAIALTVDSASDTESTTAGQRHRLGTSALIFVPLAALAVALPGFLPALLRPISWLWIRPDPQLLPSGAPALTVPGLLTAHGLICFYLFDVWRRSLACDARSRPSVALVVICSLIGLGFSRYLCLSAILLTVIERDVSLSQLAPRWGRRAVVAAAGLWIAIMVSRDAGIYTEWMLTGSVPNRLVDPGAWGTKGGVLLFNLDQADDWRLTARESNFQLLLDDRWDLYGDLYPTYAAVCRDIGEVRHERYRHGDGTWGGYRVWLRKWNPSLIVADARDLVRIRSMSLSPDHRILSLDGQRTVFSFVEQPQSSQQAALAMRVLSQLEWPTNPTLDPRVIIAPTDADKRRVAAGLNAIRLPYAALRLAPASSGKENQQLRAWCYLELAHRSQRYSGSVSLLDQFRGVALAREGLDAGWWNSEDRSRIAASLHGLGIPDLADRFAQLSASKADTATTEAESARQSAAEGSHAQSDSEVQVRQILARGDVVELQRLLAQSEIPHANNYRFLLGAPQSNPVQLYHELAKVSDGKDQQGTFHGEIEFYLGCLAIEAGDADSARRWFLASRQHDQHSPREALRAFYLIQLGSG